MIRFAFEPIYDSIVTAILCAVVVFAVIVLVTPPTKHPGHRKWLIFFRCIAALLLLLAAFRPSLIRTDSRPSEATLIVAADVSRSMTLPDGDGSDRWTTQNKAWRQLIDGIDALDSALDLKLLVYDGETKVISSPTATSLDALKPEGELTDLSAATAKSIQTAAGKPLAGVIFMGDGTQTAALAGSANTDSSTSVGAVGAERSVETLNALAVPFWPIPIGPAAGAGGSRDAAVDALDESFQLFAGNEFDISFQLSARGLAGIELPVQLTWIAADGTETEGPQRTFVSQKSNDVTSFKIPLTAPAPGSYRLRVDVPKQSGEMVTVNNSQTAFVQVREGGGRILYLEGDHRPEQKFLNRALSRFPDLDMTFKALRSDRQWPVDLDNWFDPGKFDIYILGDVDADAIGNEQLEKLTQRVAEGAGLVMLGGFNTFDAGGYGATPLSDAIPVKLSSTIQRRVRGGIQADRSGEVPGQISGPIPLEMTRDHPITNLGGDDPASAWKELPPQKGANRFLGPRVAPGVQVILESPEKKPMMIVGEFGRARTAAVAFDSTWQWWRSGKSETHRRFWRQLVLWLLAREESGGDKIIVNMDSRRFAIENPPDFQARVESLSDAEDAIELIAEVIDSSGNSITVASTNEPSITQRVTSIKGSIPKLESGFYTLRVRAKNEGDTMEPAEMAFQAIDASREMSKPMADPVYLKQLADMTADHGGAAFGPDDIDSLLDTIAKRRKQAESPIVKKHRLGDGPVSGWLIFLLFAAALSIEWFLRRTWGLA